MSCLDLSGIAEAALFLHERLRWEDAEQADTRVPDLAEHRLERWCQELGLADRQALHEEVTRRWPWERVLAVLASDTPVSVSAEAAKSAFEWTSTLAEIIATAKALPSNANLRANTPLIELMSPFAEVASRRVASRSPITLCSEAVADIQSAVAAEMERILADTFLLEFAKTRDKGVVVDMFAEPIGNKDRRYRRFVAMHLSDGLVSFFRTYPVLARLAATKLDALVEAITEFLARLSADRAQLIRLFAPPGTSEDLDIARLRLGLSTPQAGGRSVLVVTFAAGWSAVYKPRSLAPEMAWNELLHWLDADIRRPAVVDRGDYGWMEFVAAAPPATDEEAERLFERIGVILCTAQVCGARGFHPSDLVAAGEHPVLVDLETLVSPDPLPFGSAAARPPSDSRGEAFWSSVRVALPGAAEQHAQAVLAGFARAWRRFAEGRDDLLAENGPAAAFRRLPFRFVFRSAEIYEAARKEAQAPENLKSGLDFSLALERLRRASLPAAGSERLGPVVEAEIAALERGDLPRFGGFSDETGLSIGLPEPLPSFFRMSGFDRLRLRLEQLTPVPSFSASL